MTQKIIKFTPVWDERYLRAKYCYNVDITYECKECGMTCEGTPYFCENNALCFTCLAEINEVKNKKIKEKKRKKRKEQSLKNILKRN